MGIFKKILWNVKKEVKQATAPQDRIYYFGHYVPVYKGKESIPDVMDEVLMMFTYYRYEYKGADKTDIVKAITLKGNELVQKGERDANEWVLQSMHECFSQPELGEYNFEYFTRRIKRTHITQQDVYDRNVDPKKYLKQLVPYVIYPSSTHSKDEAISKYFDAHMNELIDITDTLLEEEREGKSIVYSGVYLYRCLINYMIARLEGNATCFYLSHLEELRRYLLLANLKYDVKDNPRAHTVRELSKEDANEFAYKQKLAQDELQYLHASTLKANWEEVLSMECASLCKEVENDTDEINDIAEEKTNLFYEKYEQYKEKVPGQIEVYDMFELIFSIEHISYFQQFASVCGKHYRNNPDNEIMKYGENECFTHLERLQLQEEVLPEKYQMELAQHEEKRTWAFETIKKSNNLSKVNEALSALEKINDIQQYDKLSMKMAIYTYIFMYRYDLEEEELNYLKNKFFKYLKDAVEFKGVEMKAVLDVYEKFDRKDTLQYASKHEKKYYEMAFDLIEKLTTCINQYSDQEIMNTILANTRILHNDFYDELLIAISQKYLDEDENDVFIKAQKHSAITHIVRRALNKEFINTDALVELQNLRFKRAWAMNVMENQNAYEFDEALHILEEVCEYENDDKLYAQVAKYVLDFMVKFDVNSNEYLYYEKKYISYLKTSGEFGNTSAREELNNYLNSKKEL